MEEQFTQFSIKLATKNRFDRYKADNKEVILAVFRKKRKLVTNDDVIKYLLDGVRARK
jgi:hypothetical protein